jgi:hypothetical protein
MTMRDGSLRTIRAKLWINDRPRRNRLEDTCDAATNIAGSAFEGAEIERRE